MLKRSKTVKRFLFFVLSVVMIFAFIPNSLLAYAEVNADNQLTDEEPAQGASDQDVQKDDSEQPEDVNEEEAKDLLDEGLKAEGEDPESEIEYGTKGLDVGEDEAVCQVGDKYYSDLYYAILDISSGDNHEATIVLLDDVTVNWTSIPIAGLSITIKDDGHKRTIKRPDNGLFTTPLFQVKDLKDSYLCFDGTSDENLCIEGGVQPEKDSYGTIARERASIAKVEGKGVLELKHATVDGGTITGGSSRAAIRVGSGGTFRMSGGIIENTKINNCRMSAAVFVTSSDASEETPSTFEMSGGTIRNNENNITEQDNCGGGVCLFAWNKKDPNAVMTMSGGSIEGNSSYHGGGVYMGGKSEMHMTGGKIANNTAVDMGGGVCVSGRTQTNPVVGWYDTNEFTMDGGVISGNEAKSGGGIYVNSDAVYLNKGVIENNKAIYTRHNDSSGHGGGVYVSEVPRVLSIHNAVITGNKARATNLNARLIGDANCMGGGLWACPTGSINLKVTDGVAVYGNEAVGDKSAGDDLVKVNYKGDGGGTSITTVTMADRMLGGGKVDWYKDGAIKNSAVGSVDTSVDRFDPSNPGEPITLYNEDENVAVKAVVSEAAIQRANEEATMIIRNNEAAHGGGIGTNGDLTLRNLKVTEWSLKAKKEWDGVPQEDQKEIEVFLKIDDEVLDSVKLNKGNEWAASFEHLPAPSSLTNPDVTVVEGYYVTENGKKVFKETNEYVVNYETTVDEENATILVTVTNSPKVTEEPPPPPDEPPEEPPEKPETPDESPDTGDHSHLSLALLLFTLSACVGVASLLVRRRENQ